MPLRVLLNITSFQWSFLNACVVHKYNWEQVIKGVQPQTVSFSEAMHICILQKYTQENLLIVQMTITKPNIQSTHYQLSGNITVNIHYFSNFVNHIVLYCPLHCTDSLTKCCCKCSFLSGIKLLQTFFYISSQKHTFKLQQQWGSDEWQWKDVSSGTREKKKNTKKTKRRETGLVIRFKKCDGEKENR